MRSPRGKWLVAALLVGSGALAEQRQLPPLLLGGAQLSSPQHVAETDPALRRGPAIEGVQPPTLDMRQCSRRMPVCVHASHARAEIAEIALEQLETAYERLVFVVGLPAPLADTGQGGGPELDLYLLDNDALETPRVELGQPLAASDRAPAYCAMGIAHVSLQHAARCVAGAVSAALDCAETPAVRGAYASYLTSSYFGPDLELISAVDDWQANPQANTFGADPEVTNAGAAWFAFLDDKLSAGAPGALPTALLALSRAVTDDAHPEFNNEPDVFDVLRSSLPGDDQLSKLSGEWAVSRAFLGSRSDHAHAPGLAWLGNFGRLVFDWNLKYSSLPRRVASARALEPMGVSAVWVELDSVPLGAQLGVRIEWEEPVSFNWLIVAVDDVGRETRRWELPRLQRGQLLEKTLLGFEEAAGLMFIGTNLGGVDLDHPFDPDGYPWEPHAYTLYLAPLP